MDDYGCVYLGQSSMCLTQTPPMLKVGWQFYQQYSSGSPWIIRFRPNFDAQVNFAAQLTIASILFDQVKLEIDEFMINLFVELAIWPTGYVCVNTGWEVETILITATNAVKIYDCYSTLINTLSAPFTWTDIPSFDNCAYSDDEEVTIKEWDVVTADEINYFNGDGTTANCKPGYILSPHVAKMLHEVVLP